MAAASPSIREIPEQTPVSWTVACAVSWGGLRRRFLRSLITMSGVVLAIFFLTYMMLNDNIATALVAFYNQHQVENAPLRQLLTKGGVDVDSGGQSDQLWVMLIGLSLLICLVGIINAMLMSVTERVKEIGTLKCLGATDGFILKSYFIESSLQGVLGTALGMVIGLIVALSVACTNYWGYVLPNFPFGQVTLSLLKALVMGSLISVMAAIGPAWLAARKEPVEAMRVEE